MTELLFVVNFVIFCCICIPYEFLWLFRPRKGRVVTGVTNAFVYSMIFTVLVVYVWYIAVIVWLLLGLWLASKTRSKGGRLFVIGVFIVVAILLSVIGIENRKQLKSETVRDESYEDNYENDYYDEGLDYNDTEDDYYDTEYDVKAVDDSVDDFIESDDYDYKEDNMNSADSSEYILPYSDSEYLDDSEVENLSADELRLARNEIYARHGRLFKDSQLQQYFDSCSWYEGSIEPDDFNDDTMLNDYEKYNRDLISQYEN